MKDTMFSPTNLHPPRGNVQGDTLTITLALDVVNDHDRPVTVVGVRWEPIYAGECTPPVRWVAKASARLRRRVSDGEALAARVHEALRGR